MSSYKEINNKYWSIILAVYNFIPNLFPAPIKSMGATQHQHLNCYQQYEGKHTHHPLNY
jgi:hypothetical protein